MRTIRNSFLALLTISLVAVFASCGGQKQEAAGPKDVAQSFLDTMAQGNFEAAKAFATDASRQNLDMMSSMGEGPMGACTVSDVKVDGDSATATYSMKGSDKTMTLDMVKVDGNWKVKFEQPVMDMGGKNEDMENSADTTMNDSNGEMHEDQSKSDMEEEKTETDKTSGEKTTTIKPEKRTLGGDDSKTTEKTPTKK